MRAQKVEPGQGRLGRAAVRWCRRGYATPGRDSPTWHCAAPRQRNSRCPAHSTVLPSWSH